MIFIFQTTANRQANGSSPYDAVPCGIVHCTMESDPAIVFANRAACAMLGYADLDELQERTGCRAFAHLPAEERRAAEERFALLLKERGDRCELHHRVLRGDGSSRWVHGTAALAGDGDRTLVHVAFNDATELHETQYARDCDRYATVLCSAFDEVYEVNVEHDVSRLLSSRTRPEAVGRSLPLPVALDAWERHVAGGRRSEHAIASIRAFAESDEPSLTTTYRLRHKGRIVWTESTLMRMGREGFLCCNMDVTERMRSEDEEIARNIGAIVTRLPVGIGVFEIRDKHVVPLYVSDPVCAMLGYSREEYDRRIAAKTRLFEASLLASTSDAPADAPSVERTVGADLDLARADGSPITVRVRGSLTRSRTGRYTLFAAIADVTEEVRAQNARAWESERHRILSELTGSISFDYDSRTDETLLYVDSGQGVEAQTVPHYLDDFESARRGVIHEEDVAAVRAMFDHLDERDGASTDYRADYRGDGYRWHRANLFKVTDLDGAWHLIGIVKDIQDERELKQKAELDQLTGLVNHATTKRLFAEALSDPALEGRCVCALLDVDDFKLVNDTFGHVKGDEFLKFVGTHARNACRATDVVGRVGGDEFAVLFKGATLETAVSRLDEIRNRVVRLAGQSAFGSLASISIGVYAVEPGVLTYEEAVSKADEALYRSKGKGKNRISVSGHGGSADVRASA